MSRRMIVVLAVIAVLVALAAGVVVVANLSDAWNDGTGGGAGLV